MVFYFITQILYGSIDAFGCQDYARYDNYRTPFIRDISKYSWDQYQKVNSELHP